MNHRPRRDLFWPPILLALALACVVGCFLAWRRGAAVRPAPEARARGEPPRRTNRLTIEFLDVGQGDSALIRSPEGKLALIDAGPTNRVVKLLRSGGSTGSTSSSSPTTTPTTTAGCSRSSRSSALGSSSTPRRRTRRRAYEAILREVRDSGMTAIQPTDAPRKVKLGSVLLTILPQPPVDPHNENNNSIGLRVDFGDFSALLTGDSEVAERAWWREHAPDLCAGVAILKLAHHGSRNGTDAAWLRLDPPESGRRQPGARQRVRPPPPRDPPPLASRRRPARPDRPGRDDHDHHRRPDLDRT